MRIMCLRLGHSKDVAAGQMRVFNVAGAKVNVVNRANVCTHTGCSLVMGGLEGTTVTRWPTSRVPQPHEPRAANPML